MALHEFLGEAFAGFELRRRFGGAEDSAAATREIIYYPKLKRQFRADHGHVRLN